MRGMVRCCGRGPWSFLRFAGGLHPVGVPILGKGRLILRCDDLDGSKVKKF